MSWKAIRCYLMVYSTVDTQLGMNTKTWKKWPKTYFPVSNCLEQGLMTVQQGPSLARQMSVRSLQLRWSLGWSSSSRLWIHTSEKWVPTGEGLGNTMHEERLKESRSLRLERLIEDITIKKHLPWINCFLISYCVPWFWSIIPIWRVKLFPVSIADLTRSNWLKL